MELKTWCQDIHLKAIDQTLNFPSEYAKLDPSVRSAITDFVGVKTDLYSNFGRNAADLRISLILSDFTSVFPAGGAEFQLTVAAKETSYFPKAVTVHEDFLKELVHDEGSPVIQTGYLYTTDKEVQQIIRELEPLAESGRLMIRPTPVVLGLGKATTNDGRRQWKTVFVEPNSPGDTWFAQNPDEQQNAVPMMEGQWDSNLELEMCTFALPYLDGLPFKELAKILDNEQDCLAEFRNCVREMLTLTRKKPKDSLDVLNDLIRPATDKIERKFVSITNIHRLKLMGVTLGTATLSLAALTNAGIGSALAAILGASGLGLITKEYSDYLKDRADLREMPFYLLWRLGKTGRK